MKIISYNVNGIRSALSKDLGSWISKESPDLICIQETKAQPEQIDNGLFNDLGYHFYAHSAQKKGYSGVALICRKEPDAVYYGMGDPIYDQEGRVIRADYGDISIVNVYFPSGTTGDTRQDFKMKFLFDFHNFLNKLRKERPKLVISGDFNICRLWIDIHNPKANLKTSGFLPEEREWFQHFIDDGYTDSFREFNYEPHHYSWWSFRANSRSQNKGWRIDYNIITDDIKGNLVDAGIMSEAVHSDHCPVWLELNL
ncbi:MAG TPA: exodeoxyribonuclease III [Bacteroidales bacterium]|nr:exodeoxyribonuclease III [Bacteroidales bacterium]